MDICVIGLGLIGGSLAKAIKKYTDYRVYGWDTDAETLRLAEADGILIPCNLPEGLKTSDLVLVALSPERAVSVVTEQKFNFKKGAVVADVAGVKAYLHNTLYSVLEEVGVTYLGAHPMAGKEVSGYVNAEADLFRAASMILTPVEKSQAAAVKVLTELSDAVGFGAVTVTTPEHHDRVIAYTSQLAHVVSGAYVKSPTIAERGGYSAGSFQDLTRVAKLDENLWTSLMMLNREPLIAELDTLICNLSQYRQALATKNDQNLFELLKEGRRRKEKDIDRNRREK